MEEFEYNYKEATTFDLLKTLRRVRKIRNHYPLDLSTNEKDSLEKLWDALKQELATREHIPNKKERKIIRQKRAKSQP